MKAGLDAGRLRETVLIQSPPGTDDGTGGQTGSWTTTDTVRAEVRPLSGTQQLLAGAQQGVTGYRVTIRATATVTTAYRLLWQSRLGNIELGISVITNPDMNGVAWELLCTSGLPT